MAAFPQSTPQDGLAFNRISYWDNVVKLFMFDAQLARSVLTFAILAPVALCALLMAGLASLLF